MAADPARARPSTRRRLRWDAYRDFGKGSGHPAKLNFGDCFAYALAKFTNEPLLFKCDYFAHTDIRPAATERGSAVDSPHEVVKVSLDRL